MIPASAALQDAVRHSNNITVAVDLYRGNRLMRSNLPVTAGAINYDRGSKVRSDAKLTIAGSASDNTDIDCKRGRVKVYRTVDNLDLASRQQVGEYRIDKIDRSNTGTMALDCSGLEMYVIDDRFLVPRTPPYGVSTTGAIRDLILESLPTATVIARNTYNAGIRMTSPWDRDRWDAIDTLAESIGAEVYCNYLGQFIITDIPSITDGVPVMTIDEGEGGVMIARKEIDDRAQVYNAVSASNDSTDTTVAPVWAWAYDNDPNSPTYYYGDFGHVPRFYVNKYFTTTDQCQRTADKLLGDALAENRKLSFTTVPISFLEAGDLVAVDRADNTRTVHLLDALDFDLGPGGSLDADTRSTKVEAREE